MKADLNSMSWLSIDCVPWSSATLASLSLCSCWTTFSKWAREPKRGMVGLTDRSVDILLTILTNAAAH